MTLCHDDKTKTDNMSLGPTLILIFTFHDFIKNVFRFL